MNNMIPLNVLSFIIVYTWLYTLSHVYLFMYVDKILHNKRIKSIEIALLYI